MCATDTGTDHVDGGAHAAALADTDRALVDGVIATQVERHAQVLTSVDGELSAVTTVLRDAAARGKRLRASFCLWGARGAAGGDLPAGATEAAAAIELFHLAALVHDDIMDNSDARRGLPTVHRHFADEHHRASRHGDPANFGSAVAILAGDMCLAWSDDLIAAAVADADSDIRATVRSMWSQMRDEAFAGQHLDMLSQTLPSTSETRARAVLRFKSALYTIGRPLGLGGALGRAPALLLRQYNDIGLAAGEAFQLRDDLLGIFGDPTVTGKPVIDDVREGKRTLLVALAEQRATDIERRLLADSLGNPGITEADLLAVRDVFCGTGAVAAVEQRIEILAAQALATVDELDVDATTRYALAGLIDRCVWRQS